MKEQDLHWQQTFHQQHWILVSNGVNVFNILRESDFEFKFYIQLNEHLGLKGGEGPFQICKAASNLPARNHLWKNYWKIHSHKMKKERRKIQLQEKVDKTSKLKAWNWGRNWWWLEVFVKEVKVAEPEEVKNLETREEGSSVGRKNKPSTGRRLRVRRGGRKEAWRRGRREKRWLWNNVRKGFHLSMPYCGKYEAWSWGNDQRCLGGYCN